MKDLGTPDRCSVSAKQETIRSIFDRVLPLYGLELDVEKEDDWHPAIYFALGRKLEWPESERAVDASQSVNASPAAKILHEKRGKLSCTDAPLTGVLEVLSAQVGIPILTDPESIPTPDDLRITLRVEDLPADQTLALLCRMHSLAYVALADRILVLARESEVAQMREAAAADPVDQRRLEALGKNAQGSEEFRHDLTGIVLVRIPATAETTTPPGGEAFPDGLSVDPFDPAPVAGRAAPAGPGSTTRSASRRRARGAGPVESVGPHARVATRFAATPGTPSPASSARRPASRMPNSASRASFPEPA